MNSQFINAGGLLWVNEFHVRSASNSTSSATSGSGRRGRIRNYSINLKEGVLFANFEYHGFDCAADMQKMAASPAMEKSWELMEPMHDPLRWS